MSNLFDKKDVFSWSNCEEARQYIGEEGYFCDTYHENLAAWHKGLLQDVDQSMTVECIFEDEENEVFGLFLPADKVKPPQPKIFRPYTDLNEFQNNVGGLSETVLFRSKNDKEHMYKALIVGFDFYTRIVCLSYYKYSLKELFDRFEWFNCRESVDGEWQPFGVEE